MCKSCVSEADKAKLEKILAELKAANPEQSEAFSISRHGCTVGLTVGESVLMLFGTMAGREGVCDMRMPGNKALTFPLKDW